MFRTRLYQDYPSNLTDAQWEILKPLIPPIKPDAAFYLHERRTIVDAILYVLRSGCPWRSLPMTFPPGRPSIITFVYGGTQGSGIRCSPLCACR